MAVDYKSLTPDLAVAAQLASADVAAVAAAGFKSIVCNRPDDEAAGQPRFAEIAEAAAAAGLATSFLPVASGKVTEDDAAKFSAVLAELPKPVLAYCRSGTRSTTLWTLSQTGTGHGG